MFARVLILVAVVLVGWSVYARTSQAHGARQVVTVKPYETLWSIAAAHYSGDVRDGVWRIERANHLQGADLSVGQRLVLP